MICSRYLIRSLKFLSSGLGLPAAALMMSACSVPDCCTTSASVCGIFERRDLKQKSTRLTSCLAAASGAAATSIRTGTAIEARNIFLSLNTETGQIPVLKNCSVEIPEGQFWMLLGPNGCGKSTLLKCLAGLLRHNRGEIHVAQPKSFVFQNPDHQVVMPTAEADVAFGLGRFKLTQEEVKERVMKSLESVGMESYLRRPIQTLSGGQKQRVAIAGALAESSKVLLLDELTTFLDENDQMGVLEAVRGVVGGPSSVTSLWVTHRLEELSYADGAVYMEDGHIVLSGPVSQVKEYIDMKKRKR